MQREGYARIVTDGKVTAEAATIGCGHCQRIVHLHDRDGVLRGDRNGAEALVAR